MVDITIQGSSAIFDVEGLDKIWSLKSRLEIPLQHIRGARIDTSIAHAWWKGLRAPGTNLPGVISAGTFYHDGKRVFWDVHDPEQTIVVELADERYNELVLQVADPQAAVAQLNQARSRSASTENRR